MITVTGEALIDLVMDGDGCPAAAGGRTVQYGQDHRPAGPGTRLPWPPVPGQLRRSATGPPRRGRRDAGGAAAGRRPHHARHRGHRRGGSPPGPPLPGRHPRRPPGGSPAHPPPAPRPPAARPAGPLALVVEPIATSIERLTTTGLPAGTLVMIAPNCRPGAIADKPAYQARLSRLLRRADVVKVSVEDLAYLYPGATARAAAAIVLGQGPRLVLVTDGPRPARALLPGQELSVEVPAVRVVDTIGAGDAFGGAFLAWWSGNELTRPDLQRPGPVRRALQAAVEVASVTCTRAGAEPPWPAELAGKPRWGPRPGQR